MMSVMNIPSTMHAMMFFGVNQKLEYVEVPTPKPLAGQVLLRVLACGVCRTDLHIVDGDLSNPKLPLVLGHEIVGEIVEVGENVTDFKVGERVGVPWLGYTDGTCRFCKRGMENLCEKPLFTGYTMDGGFAEYTVAYQQYCFRLPESYSHVEVAPLLCAGLIGYRTYRLAGEGIENLGIYGFGAAAHIIAQIAKHQGKRIFAFTRPGDSEAQEFALRIGADWAGDSDSLPPQPLDAALLFAPVGDLIVYALKAVNRGGVVVSGGIHMSDIPSFPYRLLWEERIIRSVANLTRQDGIEFFEIISTTPVKTEVQPFPLKEANNALDKLRRGELQGAAVLVVK